MLNAERYKGEHPPLIEVGASRKNNLPFKKCGI